MSHLEIFDAVIHDLLKPAAIGCDVLFRRTAINAQFAAASGALDPEAC